MLSIVSQWSPRTLLFQLGCLQETQRTMRFRVQRAKSSPLLAAARRQSRRSGRQRRPMIASVCRLSGYWKSWKDKLNGEKEKKNNVLMQPGRISGSSTRNKAFFLLLAVAFISVARCPHLSGWSVPNTAKLQCAAWFTSYLGTTSLDWRCWGDDTRLRRRHMCVRSFHTLRATAALWGRAAEWMVGLWVVSAAVSEWRGPAMSGGSEVNTEQCFKWRVDGGLFLNIRQIVFIFT